MEKEMDKKETPKAGAMAPKDDQRRKMGGKRPPRRASRRPEKEKDEFEQRVVDLARVTRVMAGGKRMNFRATMIIGDRKGRVGLGIAKGADVAMAIGKAVAQARKKLITVPIIENTIPHTINVKFKAAKVMIRPAKAGSGIKAGGVVRTVLELAGVKDAVAKILGASNKINNAKATLDGLNSFKTK